MAHRAHHPPPQWQEAAFIYSAKRLVSELYPPRHLDPLKAVLRSHCATHDSLKYLLAYANRSMSDALASYRAVWHDSSFQAAFPTERNAMYDIQGEICWLFLGAPVPPRFGGSFRDWCKSLIVMCVILRRKMEYVGGRALRRQQQQQVAGGRFRNGR